MIASTQIKAARALLGWTAEDLATSSGVGISTIRRLELQEGVPNANVLTLSRLKSALEKAGVEFIGTPEDRPGVRLAK
jgi:transcriptional regulator with XRE-family HTH domain